MSDHIDPKDGETTENAEQVNDAVSDEQLDDAAGGWGSFHEE